MTNKRLHGFTLIEILVAVLVFGLGVLGVAALSATSQKTSLQAYHSMLATWKAQEMMESIRANRQYALQTTANYLRAPSAPALSEPGKDCIQTAGETVTTTCSAADMAADDLYEWVGSLSGYLPSASGAVSAAGSSFTVTVLWDAGSSDQSCSSHGYSTSVSRACQSLSFKL